MRTAPKDSWEQETETGVTYTELQWDRVLEVRTTLSARPDDTVAVAEEVDPEPQLTTAVMGLVLSIVTHDTSQVSLYTSPLMHFLAVCGVNPTTQVFQLVFAYTPILAQVLWIVRLVMLEYALPLVEWPELWLNNRRHVGPVAERVQSVRKKHLCEGSFSPTSSILTQLACGKAINQDHRSESNIYWSDDRQTVFHKGKPVVMIKIRTLFQELTHELEEILHELLFHQDVPDVPLRELIDSMGAGQSFRHDGYCFLDHNENIKHCKVSWEFLYKRMLDDEPEWHLVRGSGSGSGSGEHEWVDHRKSACLNRERQFLQKFMVLKHMSGGQPARGPELGSLKVVNSVFSARSIYIINGRAVFLTTYDKAQKRRGKTEFVLRCLADQGIQLLAKYLIYVRPFSQVLGQKEWDYLFADTRGPCAGNELSRALAVATAKHLGVRLTILDFFFYNLKVFLKKVKIYKI